MKWTRTITLAAGVAIVWTITAIAQQDVDSRESQTTGLPAGIVWYGELEDGLKAAKLSERPVLLLSAAPQCAGVPGMW